MSAVPYLKEGTYYCWECDTPVEDEEEYCSLCRIKLDWDNIDETE